MHPKRLLVLDMDNTLYDWRAHFCAGFEPMVTALSELTGESRAALKTEFRRVHQQEGHMEWVSAIRRLPSVARWVAHEPGHSMAFDALLRELVEYCWSSIQAYPGVAATLSAMTNAGWTAVVFTESPAIATANRLSVMNLVDIVSTVYGAQARSSEAVSTRIPAVELPAFSKPSPQVLREIVSRHGASLASAIYVGDSLTRDMPMARAAGVTGVWAKYGSIVDDRHRLIISEVSCWAADKVSRELMPEMSKSPHISIDSFPELVFHTGRQDLSLTRSS
jgi:phosphoglycolate phosphatase